MRNINSIVFVTSIIFYVCFISYAQAKDLASDCQRSAIENRQVLVDIKCVSTSIAIEKILNSRQGVELKEKQSWFDVVPGNIPVIISAPHATSPLRNGKRRFSDGGGTAALALAIGKITGATVIYTTYEGPSDPNYYDDNQYKDALNKLIKDKKHDFLLDLHGSHPYRSYDVDLGTMNGKSLLGNDYLLADLIAYLKADGINSISLNRFSAAKNQTITKFASTNDVPAIQLEINATWVTPSDGNINAQRYSLLVQALSRFVMSSQTKNDQ